MSQAVLKTKTLYTALPQTNLTMCSLHGAVSSDLAIASLCAAFFSIFLGLIMCIGIAASIFVLKAPKIDIFTINQYGAYIGISFGIIGFIQFLMGITVFINLICQHINQMFVFEGLALCQQALYFIIILLVGGVYDETGYDNNKRVKVCLHEIILFYLV